MPQSGAISRSRAVYTSLGSAALCQAKVAADRTRRGQVHTEDGAAYAQGEQAHALLAGWQILQHRQNDGLQPNHAQQD